MDIEYLDCIICMVNKLNKWYRLIRQKDIEKSCKTIFNEKKEFDYPGVLITNQLLWLAAILALVLMNSIHCFHAASQTPRMKHLIENHESLSKMYKCNKC